MIASNTLMETTTNKINIIGKPVPAIGLYGHTTSSVLNTISFYTTKFVGRIHIYGTLCTNPNTNDWAEINLSGNPCKPFIELNDEFYPLRYHNFSVNVDGAYTYLMAHVDRKFVDFINYDLLDEIDSDPTKSPSIPKNKIIDHQMYRDSIINRIGIVNKIVLTI